MTEAIRRLGISYGKLGLSTDPGLIGRRAEGVKAAAKDLKEDGLASLVQAAFDVGSGEARFGFLSHFEDDPTFGVRPGDREAVLLAGAVAEHAMEGGSGAGPTLALGVVACACGGLREPPLNDELVEISRRCLSHFQGQAALQPVARTYSKQPQTLTDAIAAVPAVNMQNVAQFAAGARAALQAAGDYAESVAVAAARSDQQLLDYVRSLEQEMRVHWWVTGGWSEDCKKPFRQLPLALAAICAGKELAGKHAGTVGLFAAPALIDLVLERGRTDTSGNVTFQDSADVADRPWRKAQFAGAAAGQLAALIPLTAALGLSAASDDADDWKPRFERLTGLKPDAALPATELGVQLYRERLLARALG